MTNLKQGNSVMPGWDKSANNPASTQEEVKEAETASTEVSEANSDYSWLKEFKERQRQDRKKLKLDCLRLAQSYAQATGASKPTDEIIKQAQAYFDFCK